MNNSKQRGDKKLVGNYRIDLNDIIGEGPAGKVYMAKDLKSGMKRVAKEIHLEISNENLKRQVEEQIMLMKKIASPGIVYVYEGIITKHNIYIIQQYCEGGDLRKLMKQNPKGFIVEQSVTIAAKILKSYEILVKESITHRSLQPENILIQDHMFKISNFSAATCISSKISLGGLNFANVKKSQNYDVWGFGVIFYELLYGKIDFPVNLEDKATYQWFKTNQIKYPSLQNCIEIKQQKIKKILENCLKVDEAKRWSWQLVYKHQIFIEAFSHLQDLRQSSILSKIRISTQRENINVEAMFEKYSVRAYSEDEFVGLIQIMSSQVNEDDAKYLMKPFSKKNKEKKLQVYFPDLKKIFFQAGILTAPINVLSLISKIIDKKTIQKKIDLKTNQTSAITNQTSAITQKTQLPIKKQGIDNYEKIIKQLETIIHEKDIDIFQVYLKNDKGRDDMLSPQEFQALIRNCGLKPKKQDIQGVFTLFDLDGNGSISYNQFYKTLCRFTAKSSRQSSIKIKK